MARTRGSKGCPRGVPGEGWRTLEGKSSKEPQRGESKRALPLPAVSPAMGDGKRAASEMTKNPPGVSGVVGGPHFSFLGMDRAQGKATGRDMDRTCPWHSPNPKCRNFQAGGFVSRGQDTSDQGLLPRFTGGLHTHMHPRLALELELLNNPACRGRGSASAFRVFADRKLRAGHSGPASATLSSCAHLSLLPGGRGGVS